MYLIYSPNGISQNTTHTKHPPNIPIKSANKTKIGIERISALIRGNTKKSVREIPIVCKASNSSLTCMVPIVAA